jgi:hypothetical protein
MSEERRPSVYIWLSFGFVLFLLAVPFWAVWDYSVKMKARVELEEKAQRIKKRMEERAGRGQRGQTARNPEGESSKSKR